MIAVTTSPQGVAPFSSSVKANYRILSAQCCSFSIGDSERAAIPTADFRISCIGSDLKLYGNGFTVFIITE